MLDGNSPWGHSPFLSSFLSFFPFNSLFLLTSLPPSSHTLPSLSLSLSPCLCLSLFLCLSPLLPHFLFTSYIPLFTLFIPLLLVSGERERTGRERKREVEWTAASLAFLQEFHPRTCRMTIQGCKLPTFYWVSRYASIMVSPSLTFADTFRIISVELRSEHCGINGRYAWCPTPVRSTLVCA